MSKPRILAPGGAGTVRLVKDGLPAVLSNVKTGVGDNDAVNKAQLDAATGGSIAYQVLTDAATVVWDVDDKGFNATVSINGARTLDIQNAANGQFGTLIVTQGTGGDTLALPANSKVVNGGGGSLTLSSNVGEIDIITWTFDGTDFYFNVGLNYT